MKGGSSLKTIVRVIAVIMIFTVVGFFINISEDHEDGSTNQNRSSTDTVQSTQGTLPESANTIQTEGLINLIGKSSKELETDLGKPVRVDLSAYGYKWWIYPINTDKYVQVGVEADKVVTIFAIGKDVNIRPFYIGQPVSEIYAGYTIETIFNLNYKDTTYQFELSEEDINSRPLIRLGNVFVQLYIDKFSGELSSVRLMDIPTLIKLRPFELANKELKAAKNKVVANPEALAKDNERQVFDLINTVRLRFDLKPFLWDDKAAMIAYEHSVNMYENNGGSQQSNQPEELLGRLKEVEPNTQKAEVIVASEYLDAPAVVEGWLNSIAHREKLLNKDYSHTGIGVYKTYYTQNLLQVLK